MFHFRLMECVLPKCKTTRLPFGTVAIPPRCPWLHAVSPACRSLARHSRWGRLCCFCEVVAVQMGKCTKMTLRVRPIVLLLLLRHSTLCKLHNEPHLRLRVSA